MGSGGNNHPVQAQQSTCVRQPCKKTAKQTQPKLQWHKQKGKTILYVMWLAGGQQETTTTMSAKKCVSHRRNNNKKTINLV